MTDWTDDEEVLTSSCPSELASELMLEDVPLEEPITVPQSTHYVMGTLLGGAPVVATVAPSVFGWTCRSIYRDALCHDYICGETEDQLGDWLTRDLRSGWRTTHDAAEAAEFLASMYDQRAVHRRPYVLVGNPTLDPVSAAGEVLRHLGRGL